jgi:hypothetical protein
MAEITKADVVKLCGEFSAGTKTTDAASDLWVVALKSMVSHWDHHSLNNRSVITLVDFRIKATEKRLWVFRIYPDLTRLLNALVAHGAKSGRADGPGEKDKMSNTSGSHQSSVGGMVTLNVIQSTAGHLGEEHGHKKSGPALIIDGLDKGVNDHVKAREIIFHGASYVTAKMAGRSYGCFATEPSINKKIIDIIKGGTFVYAYAG